MVAADVESSGLDSVTGSAESSAQECRRLAYGARDYEETI
jgi:hypothetical protein